MKIRGQLELSDCLKAQLLHVQPDRLPRLMIYFALAFFGCLGVFGSIKIIAQGGSGGPDIVPTFVLVPAFALFWRYMILPQQVLSIFTQHKELQLPFEMEITESGLLMSNAIGHSNRPWNMFKRWKENQEMLLLYFSDIMFIMIPKRFLTEPQQSEAIIAYLRQNGVVQKTKKGTLLRTVFIVILLLVVIVAIFWSVRSQTPTH